MVWLCFLSGYVHFHILYARFGVELQVFGIFERKWLECGFSDVLVNCMLQNAIMRVWLHSLLNSGDFGIWHARFRVLCRCFGI